MSPESRSESEVTFPAMRQELQYAVRALADEDFQIMVWGQEVKPYSQFAYSFDMAFHALLDDSTVAEQEDDAVGTVLKDHQELMRIQELISAARRLIRDIGVKGSYAEARGQASWISVIEAAKRARSSIGDPPSFP
jgi:hypothetical protein